MDVGVEPLQRQSQHRDGRLPQIVQVEVVDDEGHDPVPRRRSVQRIRPHAAALYGVVDYRIHDQVLRRGEGKMMMIM